MACYIKIGANDETDAVVEVPSEKDGSLLMSTVKAQYPGSVGLRFKSDAGAWRGCRVNGNVVDAPVDGWGDRSYYIVRQQAPKRTAPDADAGAGASTAKQNRNDDVVPEEEPFGCHIVDLMIADLPFAITDEEVRDHFEQFGLLESFKINKNEQGKSRGFGFMKYSTAKATRTCLSQQNHPMMNRNVVVKLTQNSLQMLQMGYGLECMPNDRVPTKVFVGRLPPSTTSGELLEVFKKYGPLKDVYIPPQAKGYGFVTFESVVAAFRAICDSHTLNGQILNVAIASRKKDGTETDVPKTRDQGIDGMVTSRSQSNDQLAQFLRGAMERMSNENSALFKVDNMRTANAGYVGNGGYLNCANMQQQAAPTQNTNYQSNYQGNYNSSAVNYSSGNYSSSNPMNTMNSGGFNTQSTANAIAAALNHLKQTNSF